MPPYFLGFKRGFTHHATDELVSLGRARDAGQAEVLGARQLELSLRSAPLCSALLASRAVEGAKSRTPCSNSVVVNCPHEAA